MNILKDIPFNVGLSLYMTDMDMMNTIQMRVLNRGHSYEKFEDAKGFIRSDEQKNSEYNDTKVKRTHADLQNITHKTKERAT